MTRFGALAPILTPFYKRTLREAIAIQEFENTIRAVTGCSEEEAREFSRIVPESFRRDARHEILMGASLDHIRGILENTFYSQIWQLGEAAKETVRAAMGMPTIGGILEAGDLDQRLADFQSAK